MTLVPMTEYRVGRNFVRVGDTVKARFPHKTNRAVVRVHSMRGEDGVVTEVIVVDPRNGGLRTLTPDAIDRVAQTKNGERKAGAR